MQKMENLTSLLTDFPEMTIATDSVDADCIRKNGTFDLSENSC